MIYLSPVFNLQKIPFLLLMNYARHIWVAFGYPLKRTHFVCHNKGTGGAHHPSMSTCTYVTNLKFVSGIPPVKWWQFVKSLFRSCGWCVTYWQESGFSDIIKNWQWRHQSTTFVKKTLRKASRHIISLTWEIKNLF